MSKVTGVVKWFNADKGYGFIKRDNGDTDVFVHISAVRQSRLDNLNEGDKVGFIVDNNPRTGKPCATQLELVA
jgi:CspA family cold shock protein